MPECERHVIKKSILICNRNLQWFSVFTHWTSLFLFCFLNTKYLYCFFEYVITNNWLPQYLYHLNSFFKPSKTDKTLQVPSSTFYRTITSLYKHTLVLIKYYKLIKQQYIYSQCKMVRIKYRLANLLHVIMEDKIVLHRNTAVATTTGEAP